MASGMGLYYGYRDSDMKVLADLLKDDYDFDITPDQQASGEYDTPISIVAHRLPVTITEGRLDPRIWRDSTGH